MKKELSFSLPFPTKCSVNSMYKWNNKGSVYLSSHAKNYKKLVCYLLNGIEGFGNENVKMKIELYAPDNRKRDIDNIQKIIQDSLQMAKIVEDDSQIKDYQTVLVGVVNKGRLDIYMESVD